MLIHPSSGAYELFVELFHGLYCSGLMCVGVRLWFGCGGVVSVCRLKTAYGYHTTHHHMFIEIIFKAQRPIVSLSPLIAEVTGSDLVTPQ